MVSRRRLGKAAWYLYFVFVHQIRRRTRGDRWLRVGPDQVERRYLPWKIAHLLGVRLVRSTDRAPSLAIRFHDATISSADSPVADRVINATCTDISKRRVEIASLATFGYGLAVDPEKHVGPMVEKSDRNATHDGAVIDGPIDAPDPSKVYQRVLDNQVTPGVIEDLRLTIVAGRVVVVFRKQRPLRARFANVNTHVRLVECSAVLSAAERRQVAALAEHMGLDLGELDVVRDRVDGRIFVVDVANTPVAPPVLAHTIAGLRAMHRVAHAFEREWGAALSRADA